MATTTNYTWNLPTVGGDQDTWGNLLNSNWSSLDTLLGGVTSTEFGYLSGATGNIQSQIDTIVSAGGVPSGVIMLWSGSIASIPAGWYLCDGSNGTPNLRDRFVVGAGSTYAVASTGGAATVSLSTAEMPSHTHTFTGTTSTDGSHDHTVSWTAAEGGSGLGSLVQNYNAAYTNTTTSTAGSHSHTVSGTTDASGSGAAHENRPPYYALAYIMKA